MAAAGPSYSQSLQAGGSKAGTHGGPGGDLGGSAGSGGHGGPGGDAGGEPIKYDVSLLELWKGKRICIHLKNGITLQGLLRHVTPGMVIVVTETVAVMQDGGFEVWAKCNVPIGDVDRVCLYHYCKCHLTSSSLNPHKKA